ncbi:MAG: UPF0235 protein [bacterium]|nr:MAG: UPF0235 protein [bacterium]
MNIKSVKTGRDGVVLTCRVVPSSSKNEIVETTGEALRIRITSPPVDGKANKALTAFLAGKLKMPKSRISIIKGQAGRLKKVLLAGVEVEDVNRILGGVS